MELRAIALHNLDSARHPPFAGVQCPLLGSLLDLLLVTDLLSKYEESKKLSNLSTFLRETSEPKIQKKKREDYEILLLEFYQELTLKLIIES
jgi:hypothetical protein